MIYYGTDELPLKERNCDYYFLAGSIDYNASNPWRESLIKKAKASIHFFDPTRRDHDSLSHAEMQNHIHWELEALELSDTIVLHFLRTAKSPISLVELGLYARSGKLIVVCPNTFYQRRYIEVLCKKYSIVLCNSLNEVIV
ncbi:nucleoside 2-deoxyribosyltransferase domain-containing protein [uncultured Psychroserpens sp.]|uniref:nucleoside 2-deoxyribosyltransferase domain-containing protein n=1 Tax=uncultured Psychroserpens sp. TaxID=255436 RepID=UPI0026347908|nr:nucleoside 2-deoxyribosyltransferase domain-containing protein [uncultured Psychroserpens sp.]